LKSPDHFYLKSDHVYPNEPAGVLARAGRKMMKSKGYYPFWRDNSRMAIRASRSGISDHQRLTAARPAMALR
jgi:hypothetical protein